MSKILVMEAANLSCGDHDPSASKHLTLSEIQLPVLQEMYADHHAGGSGFQIEIAVGKQKMEAMTHEGFKAEQHDTRCSYYQQTERSPAVRDG